VQGLRGLRIERFVLGEVLVDNLMDVDCVKFLSDHYLGALTRMLVLPQQRTSVGCFVRLSVVVNRKEARSVDVFK